MHHLIAASCSSQDNWPTAIEVAAIAFAATAAYAVWRFTGGKHMGEEHRHRHVDGPGEPSDV